ncbi:DUF1707 and DUF4190 domain-containing protein [Kitasatospora sp. NPDC088134]|uniref:DUF1707 and DUF4190 domain-containing protein n=1 Tax=Kitasatospora sp. NPDC088134 TaxID=3364071 RepID=UPI003810E087
MSGQWGSPAPYGQQPWQPAPTPQSAMRAAHSDRERTVDVLKAAYAEGRLSAAEYEHRMSSAHQAATYGQLASLVADLPAGPMVQPFGAAVPMVPPTFLPPAFPPPPRPNNGLATASAILGGLTLFTGGLTGLPAVITGHIARGQIRRTREAGDGLAVFGLILGWLSMAGWALFSLLFLLAASGH